MTTMARGTFALALACMAGTTFAQLTGPSSSQSPYVLPTRAGVVTQSLLTAGDTVGGYMMVGIPDGSGAFNNGDGSFTFLVNHEIPSGSGGVRAHGSTGGFVSRWSIDAATRTVISGRDHNTGASDVNTWNGTGFVQGTTAYSRLCSADLAKSSAYKFGGLGTDARLFLNGEEAGPEGRAFAHVVTGAGTNQSWQLPSLGRFSWENAMANPKAQAKTVVMGTDDTSNQGQVYMYVGNKQSTGNDIERAGLTNGELYGVRVTGVPSETRPGAAVGRFDLYNHGDVRNTTGADLNTASAANSVTNFLRPEDGAWDHRIGHENDFYFVTTDRFNSASQEGHSRLYRMRFDDITNPTLGGQVDMLIDGFVSGPNMMDNICIDNLGRILIQEDIGGQDPLGAIWLYDIASQGLVKVAEHDPFRFDSSSSGFLTRDEEASGIIDATDILGQGWFLMTDQAHYSVSGEQYEGGQLLALYVDPSIVPAPGAAAVLGLGALAGVRRRRA
ncbi:MAG: DUF839 domain-containing protein [Phycisphaerae bacterium]|nr:DUF839 domain-containing protein [Phycisphaerae bacterium]